MKRERRISKPIPKARPKQRCYRRARCVLVITLPNVILCFKRSADALCAVCLSHSAVCFLSTPLLLSLYLLSLYAYAMQFVSSLPLFFFSSISCHYTHMLCNLFPLLFINLSLLPFHEGIGKEWGLDGYMHEDIWKSFSFTWWHALLRAKA